MMPALRPAGLTAGLAWLLLSAGCAPAGPPRGFVRPDLALDQAQAVTVPGVPGLPGFSSAIKVGPTLYLAGQVPLDSAGRLVGPGDLAAQAGQAFLNVARVIRAVRGVPADLVKLTAYVADYDTAAVAVIRRAIEPYLEPGAPAALTIVGVSRLPEPGMLVVLDGVAVLRGQLPDRTRDRGP